MTLGYTEVPDRELQALRAENERLRRTVTEALTMIPSVSAIVEMTDEWIAEEDEELNDCLTGLRDHLRSALEAKP